MAQRPGRDGKPRAADGRRPVTLRDVAIAAAVSPATASKALNGLGRMTADTRQRIKQTAQAMGFRPNALAQSLTRKRSFTVGLLTNDSYGRFSLPVMAGISEALADAGVSVFLCNVEDDPRLGQMHLQAMLDRQVDGIIATGRRVDRHLPVTLEGIGVPVVYAFTRPTPDAPAFVSNDADGAAQAIRHLAALGRRRIAHVTGPASFEVVQVRADAARQALRQAGLEASAPLLGTWSEAFGHEAVGQLFGPPARRPDAIFCGNDQIARGVVDALRERGIGVPERRGGGRLRQLGDRGGLDAAAPDLDRHEPPGPRLRSWDHAAGARRRQAGGAGIATSGPAASSSASPAAPGSGWPKGSQRTG